MWDPRRLTYLWASKACYGDSFTLWRRSVLPVRYELDCKYLQVASISQLTVSRLSRQCGIINISQPYRPPRPVTGIALLYGVLHIE
jgi:hypothetical protein